MSSVFQAVHTDTKHEEALKILPRDFAKNQVKLQQFLRDTRNAEALEHPNITTILDRGVDDGRHYFVMELVEGGDLQERVKNNGPPGIAGAVSVIRAVSLGIRFAALRGLIHRDNKPANILMTPNGQVKIVNLGMAVLSENEDVRVTRKGRPSAPSITCPPSRRTIAEPLPSGVISILSAPHCTSFSPALLRS